MVLMVLINFGSFRTIQTSSCLPSATLRSWAFAPYPKAGAGMNFSDSLLFRVFPSGKATKAPNFVIPVTRPSNKLPTSSPIAIPLCLYSAFSLK